LLAVEPQVGVLEAARRLGVARGTVQARLDRMQDRSATLISLAAQVPYRILPLVRAAASDRGPNIT
jgi:hypothetical protein